jgi:hypothetical protein
LLEPLVERQRLPFGSQVLHLGSQSEYPVRH